MKNQFEALVDKRKIHIVAPIKRLGEHEVELRFHADVTTTLKVRVESTEPAANAALAAASAAQAKSAAQVKPAEAPRGETKRDLPYRKPRPPKGTDAPKASD